MEPSDLRWLAGLLEGEGTFLRPVPSAPRAPLIRLAMTDHDVVRRAAGLLERSVVSAEGGRVHGHRTVFMVTVKGAPAISWMRVLRPYLSTTRRAQVDRSLACSQVAPRQTPIEPAEAAFAAELVAGDGPCDEDWLAGLLEGEAWFGVASTGQHHYPASSWRCATRKSSAGPPPARCPPNLASARPERDHARLERDIRRFGAWRPSRNLDARP